VRRFDIDDVLLESITRRENFLPPPPPQRPPFDFIHKGHPGRRSAAGGSMLKFVTLMRSLILAESRILVVVETFPLLCHIHPCRIDLPCFSMPPALSLDDRRRRLGKDSTRRPWHSAMGRLPCGIVRPPASHPATEMNGTDSGSILMCQPVHDLARSPCTSNRVSTCR